MDDLREMRAMYLGALPYPPLPVQVGKVEDMQLAGETVTTTHSLIAKCLQECAHINNKEENKKRKVRQTSVLQQFLKRLADVGFLQEGEDLYRLYCEFSYKHIATYFPEGHPLDIRFMPMDYMSVGDKTHEKLVEYFKAQCILFEEENPDDVSSMQLGDILKLLRDKLGRAE